MDTEELHDSADRRRTRKGRSGHQRNRRRDWLFLALLAAAIGSAGMGAKAFVETNRTLTETEALTTDGFLVQASLYEVRRLDDAMTHEVVVALGADATDALSVTSEWRVLASELDRLFAEIEQHTDDDDDGDERDAVRVAMAARADATELELEHLVGEHSGDESSLLSLPAYTDAKDRFTSAMDEVLTSHGAEVRGWTDEALATHRRSRVEATLGMAFVSVVFGALAWAHVRERRRNDVRDSERDRLLDDQHRRRRVEDALEMSLSEREAVDTVGLALAQELDGWSTELLLADSSTAHLHRVLTTDPVDAPSCGVSSPTSCPAIRRGGTLVFANDGDYDACPQLRRSAPGGTAVCTPVKVMGKPVGIAHSVSSRPTTPAETDRADEIIRVFGDRIGVLRAFATTQRQAERDPLTGLLNRRSLESHVRELDQAAISYCVAFCDLDHFKVLNDTYGHAAGDRALRRFAELLTDGLRPDDLIGRWGGEEFVVVLPGVSTASAAAAIERIRGALTLELIQAEHPRFTFSAGIANAGGLEFEDALLIADQALLRAKDAGRDRVLIAGEPEPEAAPGTDAPVPHVS